MRTARWYAPLKAESGAQCFARGVVSLYVETNNTKTEMAFSCNPEIGAEDEINLCPFPLRRVYLVFGINILGH